MYCSTKFPLQIDPYDAKNIIVGMTGPITGTGFTPGGTKMCFVYLSPATRYTLGRGATSGYFGTSLKAAGYDGMIVTGAAQKPTYLYIGEDKVELRDAEPCLGQRHARHRGNFAGRIRPSGRADRLHRPCRRKSDSRGHAGQRLQSHRGARLGRGDGLEKIESLCRLGNQTAARAR